MAAIPYMPLYVADYLSDAAHLSTLEHGAYLLLIMTYWQRGESLPNDDKKLARICRVGTREWVRLRPVLCEFFNVNCNTWVHSRVERELAHVRDKSLKNRKAGLARAKQMHSVRSASAQPSDTDTYKPPISPNGESFILPDWMPASEWADFVEMRRKNRNALTDRAKRLAVNELDKLRAAGHDPAAVINQSVLNAWKGFFPLRRNQRMQDDTFAGPC